jgi:hypothetical protein
MMGRKSSDVTSRIRSVVGKQAKESPRFPGPLPLSQTTQFRLRPECSPRAQILGQGVRRTPWEDRKDLAVPSRSTWAQLLRRAYPECIEGTPVDTGNRTRGVF